MPSRNYTVALSAQRRIRVNVCEGQVNITEEVFRGSGRWVPVQGGLSMDSGQAARLAEIIASGLKADGY